MDDPARGTPSSRSKPGQDTEAAALRAELARVTTEARAELQAEQARHAAEEARLTAALLAAEHRLEVILDSASDYAIATLDLDRRLTSWNAGAERILGWRSEDILGQPCDIFFTREDQLAGVPACEAAKALSEGRARNERWHVRANGSRFFASGWTTAMRNPADPDGTPRELLIIMRDRTRERRAEEALRESEERYRYTVELSPQIPFTADPRGNVVDFSTRWTALTGIRRERTLGWGWSCAVLRTDRKPILKQWIHSLRTGDACDVEGRLRAADGSVRWFRTRIYPRRNADGAILTWHGTLEDVNERKAANERTRALLELGDRLRDLRAAPEIVLATSGIIGRILGAARVGYAAVSADGGSVVQWDWTDGRVPSLEGVLRPSGEWTRSDSHDAPLETVAVAEVVAVSDVDEDPRTAAAAPFYREVSARSLLKVPVMVGGRPAAFIFVHDIVPRAWTPEEIAFARGAAERVWSALARSTAEVSQVLLTRELNHRVKNTLAVVQAMADQTARRSQDLASFGPVFQGRLMALARAHDLLTQREWRGAPLGEVVRASLHAAGNPRVDLLGCREGKMLVPAQAVSLAMALHELSTNAVKHGALSVPEGSVCVTCGAEEDGAVQRVDWVERGGPRVIGPPPRKGFGMRLLERGLAVQSGMTSTLDFAPEGLRCSLRLPLAALPTPDLEGMAQTG